MRLSIFSKKVSKYSNSLDQELISGYKPKLATANKRKKASSSAIAMTIDTDNGIDIVATSKTSLKQEAICKVS